MKAPTTAATRSGENRTRPRSGRPPPANPAVGARRCRCHVPSGGGRCAAAMARPVKGLLRRGCLLIQNCSVDASTGRSETMAVRRRRIAGVAVMSALIFGAVSLPTGGNGTEKPTSGYAAPDSVLYGEPVAFAEDGEFLAYVSEKQRERAGSEHRRATAAEIREARRAPGRNESGRPTGRRREAAAGGRPTERSCEPVSLAICRGLDLYPLSQYPNVVGHRDAAEAAAALTPYLTLMRDATCREVLRTFVCLLMAPQCIGADDPLPPCRSVCQSALDGCSKVISRAAVTWPDEWSCDGFPSGGLCSDLDSRITPVPEPITKSKQRRHSTKYAANHAERGPPASKSQPSAHKNPEVGRAAHTSLKSTNHVPLKRRRYDIGQTGQAGLFQGWADVQGQGAANDYCRVIGSNPKLHFLSCALAGSAGSSHHYVSRRGFNVGHQGTWFMRDMDGDGRDDYCRCVGRGIKSVVTCMKAGLHGFYGSPQQPGDEYTFIIQSAGPCFQRKVNPFIGI